MKSFDVFYTGEDAHRIRPLIRFLELQEMEIRQHTRPKDDPSAPFLVIVSEGFDREPWLSDLLESDKAIAVLLGHGTPENAIRAADLSSWPARSADRALAGLAKWMKSPSNGFEFASPANEARKKAASKRSQTRQNVAGVLVILGIIALIAWLPSLTESTQGDTAEEATAGPTEVPILTTELTAGHEHSANATTAPLNSLQKASESTLHANARASRFHCQRRWSLSGRISQCWIFPEKPISLDPLYYSSARPQPSA